MNKIYIRTTSGLLGFCEAEFILYVKSLASNECKQYKDLRFGQCVFNITQELCGCIVENFRGLDEDCFYNDNKVDLFLHSVFNKVISKDDCTIN